MNSSTLTNSSLSNAKPWWSFGMVWMVIAGPAVVVVAAFATLYLAITIPDPVLPTEALNPRNAIENQGKLDAAMAPAMQARNHAATGVVPGKQK
ncbi:MAG: hypothetical protein RL462_768 [Pseudomonadota bacterium]|jgi:hypothetical protein